MAKTGNSGYRINMLDSSDNILGAGPLRNIYSVQWNRQLDSIPTLSFSVFANDPKTSIIGNPDIATPALRFDIFHEVDGYLGRFYLADIDIDDNDGEAVMVVNCQSELQALQDLISGFAREYANTAIEDIIEDLLDTASWTLDPVTTGFDANVTYQGQNLYEAIAELLKRWNLHFRLSSTTASELEIGAFGVLQTDVRLTNLRGQDGANDPSIGIVKSLGKKVVYKGIYNRIVAVGAGTGAGMLTMLDSEAGATYTVQNRTRTNGQEEFYIEDSTSITAFGVREIVVIFDQIRPIANTATAKSQAQTELLANAEQFLLLHKDPRIVYENVEVYGLQTDIKPGDKVNLRYIETDTDGNAYMSVDSDVWVLGHIKQRSATGQNQSMLTLGTLDRKEPTDTDIMASMVKAVRSEKLWIKPVAFRMSDTYIDTIQHNASAAPDKYANFTFTIDDTVTEVTRVILEWRTRPLYTLVQWSLPDITTQQTTVPPNLHTHLILGQQLNGGFGVIEDNDYPSDVEVFLVSPADGTIDITNHADVDYLTGGNGIWNSGGTNAALTVRMDITDLIVGDSGGIYQTFTISVRLDVQRTRNIAVATYSVTDPINSSFGNHGIVEGRIIIEGITQAKYKD